MDTKDWTPYKWCKEIESGKWQPNSIAIAIIMRTNYRKPFFRWLSKWRFITSKTTAKDLLNKGWGQGPKLGIELNKLRDIELRKIKS